MGRGPTLARLIAVVAVVIAALAWGVTGCGDDEPSQSAQEQLQPSDEASDADGSPGVSPAVKRIEAFGSEATGRQRTQILAGFDAYALTLTDADYRAACANLKQRARNVIEHYGSKRGVAGCPGHLAQNALQLRQEARRRTAAEVEKVRVDGIEAYVTFHAPEAELYLASMQRENGEWKAGSVYAPPVIPSSSTTYPP